MTKEATKLDQLTPMVEDELNIEEMSEIVTDVLGYLDVRLIDYAPRERLIIASTLASQVIAEVVAEMFYDKQDKIPKVIEKHHDDMMAEIQEQIAFLSKVDRVKQNDGTKIAHSPTKH